MSVRVVRSSIVAISVLALGCGGAAATAQPTRSTAPSEAVARSPHRCTIESWSHEVLGTAVGRGPDPSSASADAARQLCASLDEECPTEDLFTVVEHAPSDRSHTGWEAGVFYRLIRRRHADHLGESDESRNEACRAAERVFRASEGPEIRGVSGVNGVRWSSLVSGGGEPFPPTASRYVTAIEQLPHEAVGVDGLFECQIVAEVSPIVWQHSLPGDQGEACLAARPSSVPGSAGRRSSVRCSPQAECETHCMVLGTRREVSVKAVSQQSQLEACGEAARRMCPDGECLVQFQSIDGISTESFGSVRRSP